MSTHNLCFEQKHEKYQNFYRKTFSFLVVEISIYLNRHVFVMAQLVGHLTCKYGGVGSSPASDNFFLLIITMYFISDMVIWYVLGEGRNIICPAEY